MQTEEKSKVRSCGQASRMLSRLHTRRFNLSAMSSVRTPCTYPLPPMPRKIEL
jgi:hypothetical protein